MSFKTAKLKWAKKLLRAKMFVVMTEKESAIAIDGADPYSFTDAIALAAQAAELEMFQQSLAGLLKQHQDALKKLSGDDDAKKASATRRKTSTKQTTETRVKRARQAKTAVRGSTKAKK